MPAQTAGVATIVGRATPMILPLNTSQPLPFHLLLTALRALRVVQAARRKRKPTRKSQNKASGRARLVHRCISAMLSTARRQKRRCLWPLMATKGVLNGPFKAGDNSVTAPRPILLLPARICSQHDGTPDRAFFSC